jgi:hypothetical protein
MCPDSSSCKRRSDGNTMMSLVSFMIISSPVRYFVIVSRQQRLNETLVVSITVIIKTIKTIVVHNSIVSILILPPMVDVVPFATSF